MGKQADLEQLSVVFGRNISEIAAVLEDLTRTGRPTLASATVGPPSFLARQTVGPLFYRAARRQHPWFRGRADGVRLRAASGDNLQRFVSVIGLDELGGLGDLAGAN